MKRAKLSGLKRNAAVVVGNVGAAEDAAVLMCANDDEELLLRGHATWAPGGSPHWVPIDPRPSASARFNSA